MPWPGIVTRRSRGIESTVVALDFGSSRTSIIVSDRASPRASPWRRSEPTSSSVCGLPAGGGVIVPRWNVSVCPKRCRSSEMCFTCTMPMPTVAPAIESTITAPAITNPRRMRADARGARSGDASIHNQASPPLGGKLPGLAPSPPLGSKLPGLAPSPPGHGMGRLVLDRRLRRFGPRGNVPFAARLARGLRGGFRWDPEDSRTKDWYPQGIDARGDVVLVSWYSKRDGAARLSIADTATGRYGHVALMMPGGEPVKTHAGGLAWREDWLYVADTNRGLRLFDLRRFAGRTLPQAGWYRPESKDLRFSYASVDDAAGGPRGRGA